METYTLSIETNTRTYVHGFHLGTIAEVAKTIAEEAWHKWAPRYGTEIHTVALKKGGKVWVYDGKEWSKPL